MTVSTTSAAVHITPVVIKTLVKHARTKGRKLREGDRTVAATDDIFFDEAFHIVKAFIDMGTHNTIESLQAFTNTHVPAPYWAAVSPVLIPLLSCNRAADLLIEWFGPEDLRTVVGGERWWQVRGMDGIDAEWITQKEFLSERPAQVVSDQRLSTEDTNILRMEHLETVMLYVHGGAYFWGSINTHRYQLIRYARKMKGRVFAVNYRKAPQYPWPCPVQDVLAAYLYLTSPPEGALHKAIPTSKIVLAGDSAGAGLCITLLTVLRDLGIAQPAGAVLISPWVDLTHSFPSVMKNTATDIIPAHGFIHKPSDIWPVKPLPKPGDARIMPTQTSPPPMPGHADTLRPSEARMEEEFESRAEQGRQQGLDRPAHAGELQDQDVGSQKDMITTGCSTDKPHTPNGDSHGAQQPVETTEAKSAAQNREFGVSEDQDEAANLDAGKSNANAGSVKPTVVSHNSTGSTGRPLKWSDWKNIKDDDPTYDDMISFWEPKPPKVLMKNPDDVPLELHSQIQIYAENEQLTHPLVSPVLQGSLGNLCPLYILAGDGELLRDEIIYLAHKAAHPKDYPTRKGVLRDGNRQKENAEKFTTPTKVHLQVYDGMCHVLTVFTFTDPAKYAYRSIAEFVKHVTSQPADHLALNPFPELHRPLSDFSDSDSDVDDRTGRPWSSRADSGSSAPAKADKNKPPVPVDSQVTHHDARLYKANVEKTEVEVAEGTAERAGSSGESTPSGALNGHGKEKANGNGDVSGFRESLEQDIAGVLMIRERVDVFGRVRPMEPKEEIEALNIPVRQIGIIKEEPVRRWYDGQAKWDKRYARAAVRVERHRMRYQKKFDVLIERATAQGLELYKNDAKPGESGYERAPASKKSVASVGEIMEHRRWGPFDLAGESPAPTAIVGRKDNREALALARKSIYFTAPVTHKRVPKRTTGDAVRAVFDTADNTMKPPKQSVSEQQTTARLIPVHGLRIWQSIVTYFMRKSSRKAADGTRAAGQAVHDAGNRVMSGNSGAHASST